MRILAIKINSTDIINHNKFINSTQFDIKKLETYSKVMQDPHATQ